MTLPYLEEVNDYILHATYNKRVIDALAELSEDFGLEANVAVAGAFINERGLRLFHPDGRGYDKPDEAPRGDCGDLVVNVSMYIPAEKRRRLIDTVVHDLNEEYEASAKSEAKRRHDARVKALIEQSAAINAELEELAKEYESS